jgi:hypothetical protein
VDYDEGGAIDKPDLGGCPGRSTRSQASYPQFCLLLSSLDIGVASQTIGPLPKPPKKAKARQIEPEMPAPEEPEATRVSIEIQTGEIPAPPKPKKIAKSGNTASHKGNQAPGRGTPVRRKKPRNLPYPVRKVG